MLWFIHVFSLTCQGNSCEPHSHECSTCDRRTSWRPVAGMWNPSMVYDEPRIHENLSVVQTSRVWLFCGPSTTKKPYGKKGTHKHTTYSPCLVKTWSYQTSHLCTYPNRWQHRGSPRHCWRWWRWCLMVFYLTWLFQIQRMSKTRLSIWDKNIASSEASTKKSGWFHSRINVWQPKRIA